jgi:hypothetical protein
MMMRRNKQQQGAATHRQPKHMTKPQASKLREIVEQVVTQWLDTPEPQNLAIAYNELITLAVGSDCLTPDNYRPYDAPWMEDNCDFYRSLIVVSLLLLLGGDIVTEKQASTIRRTLERSVMLLRILVGAHKETELIHKVPTSRYPLLNALLTEPLMPLSRDERQDLIAARGYPSNDEQVEDIQDQTLALPSRKELIREELQLLQMAQKPIPHTSPQEYHDQVVSPWNILGYGKVWVGGQRQSLTLFQCGALQFLQDDQEEPLTTWLRENSIRVDGDQKVVTINSQVSFTTQQDWGHKFDQAMEYLVIQQDLCQQAQQLWDEDAAVS